MKRGVGWQKFETVFKSESADQWSDLIKSELLNEPQPLVLAQGAKTLAHLHRSKDPSLSAGYAMTSCLAYLIAHQLNPALAIYTWANEEFRNHYAVSKLHSILAAHLHEDTPKEKSAASHSVFDITLFKGLTHSEIAEVLKHLKFKKFSADDRIFSNKDKPVSFYIVIEGEVEVIHSDGNVTMLTGQDSLGEISMLLNKPTHSSVARAKTEVEVVELSKHALVECFAKYPALEERLIHTMFLRIFLNLAHHHRALKSYSKEELEIFFSALQPKGFKPGQIIFEESHPPSALYFLIEGRVSVHQIDGTELGELSTGCFLGEMAILENRPHHARAVATEKTFALVCSHQDFIKVCHKFPRFADFIRHLAAERNAVTQSRNLRK